MEVVLNTLVFLLLKKLLKLRHNHKKSSNQSPGCILLSYFTVFNVFTVIKSKSIRQQELQPSPMSIAVYLICF